MIDAPTFPQFRRIRLSDKVWYDNFYANFEPYADYSFNNLIIWLDINDDLEISTLNGNIIFKYTDPFEPTTTQFYSLLGANEIVRTVTFLLHEQQDVQILQLDMTPAVVAEQLFNNDMFIITKDDANTDYILDLAKIANLSGSELRSFREDCNSFMRKNYENLRIAELDVTNVDTQTFLLENMYSWDKMLQSKNDEAFHEGEALKRIFINAEPLGYKNVSIFINDVLESFVLYSVAPQGNFVMPNSIKTSYRYNDIYDFTVFAFANKADKDRVRYINFEQDMGLPGLRKYKQSLRPVYYLEKYLILPKKD